MTLTNESIILQGMAGFPGRWRLHTPVHYDIPEWITKRFGGPDIVTVSQGFVTDLASTPRLLWNLVPPFGRYTAGAVVHDYLYQVHQGSRRHADAVFNAAMMELNVLPIKRVVMYRAVRLFGGLAYRRGPTRMAEFGSIA